MAIVEWRPPARADLFAIVEYIAADNPVAAQALKDDIEVKCSDLSEYPELYKPGRVPGTREMVVRPNYIVVYSVQAESVSILRVLNAAQQWPPDNPS